MTLSTLLSKMANIIWKVHGLSMESYNTTPKTLFSLVFEGRKEIGRSGGAYLHQARFPSKGSTPRPTRSTQLAIIGSRPTTFFIKITIPKYIFLKHIKMEPKHWLKWQRWTSLHLYWIRTFLIGRRHGHLHNSWFQWIRGIFFPG